MATKLNLFFWKRIQKRIFVLVKTMDTVACGLSRHSQWPKRSQAWCLHAAQSEHSGGSRWWFNSSSPCYPGGRLDAIPGLCFHLAKSQVFVDSWGTKSVGRESLSLCRPTFQINRWNSTKNGLRNGRRESISPPHSIAFKLQIYFGMILMFEMPEEFGSWAPKD